MDSLQNIAALGIAQEMIREKYNPYGSVSCSSSLSENDSAWDSNDDVSSEYSYANTTSDDNDDSAEKLTDYYPSAKSISSHGNSPGAISNSSNSTNQTGDNPRKHVEDTNAQEDDNEHDSFSSRSSLFLSPVTDNSIEEQSQSESSDHSDQTEDVCDPEFLPYSNEQKLDNLFEEDEAKSLNSGNGEIAEKNSNKKTTSLPPQFPFKFVIANGRNGSRVRLSNKVEGKNKCRKNLKTQKLPKDFSPTKILQHPLQNIGVDDRGNFPDLNVAIEKPQPSNQEQDITVCVNNTQFQQAPIVSLSPVTSCQPLVTSINPCQQFMLPPEPLPFDPLVSYTDGWSPLVDDYEDEVESCNGTMQGEIYCSEGFDFESCASFKQVTLNLSEIPPNVDLSLAPIANSLEPEITYNQSCTGQNICLYSEIPKISNSSTNIDNVTAEVFHKWLGKGAPSFSSFSPPSEESISSVKKGLDSTIPLNINIPSYAQALKSTNLTKADINESRIMLDEDFPALGTCQNLKNLQKSSIQNSDVIQSNISCAQGLNYNGCRKNQNILSLEKANLVDQCDDDYDMYLDQFVYENLDQAGTYDMDTARSLYDNEFKDSNQDQYTVTLGPAGCSVSMDITEMESSYQELGIQQGPSQVVKGIGSNRFEPWGASDTISGSGNTNGRPETTDNFLPSPSKNKAKFIYKGTHFFVPYTPKSKKNQIFDPNVPKPKFFPVPKYRRGRRKRSPPRGFVLGLAGSLCPIHYLCFATPSKAHGPNYPDLFVSREGVINIQLQYGVCAELTLDKYIRLTCKNKNVSLLVNATGSGSFMYHSAGRVLHDDCTVEAHIYHDRKVKVIDDNITLANDLSSFTFTGEDAKQSCFVSFTKDNGDISGHLLYGTKDSPIDRSGDREMCLEKTNEAKLDYLELGAYTIEIDGVRINQNARGDVTVVHKKKFMRVSPSTGAIVLQTPQVCASVAPNWAVQVHTSVCRLSATVEGLVITNGHIEVGFDKDGIAFGFQLPDRQPLILQ